MPYDNDVCRCCPTCYGPMVGTACLVCPPPAPAPIASCKRPPKGWVCSRPAGHDGPCAADMAIPRQELAQALNTRYGWHLTAESIRDFMPRDEEGEVQVQATHAGYTDWYSIQTEGSKLLPHTIQQLPF